jgi:hypothetical protein
MRPHGHRCDVGEEPLWFPLLRDLCAQVNGNDAAGQFEQLLVRNHAFHDACLDDVTARSGVYAGEMELTPLGWLITQGQSKTSLLLIARWLHVLRFGMCLHPCAMFVSNRGSPFEQCSFCMTPLGLAIHSRNVAVAKLLLVAGKDSEDYRTQPCKFSYDKTMFFTPIAAILESRFAARQGIFRDFQRASAAELLLLLKYLAAANPSILTDGCHWKEVCYSFPC